MAINITIEKIIVRVDLKEIDVINKTREQMIVVIRIKIFIFLLGLKKSSNIPSEKLNAINTRYS
ncbi:hypothetical protein ACQKII_23760 [Lysinibacillus sp. NPDC048646]|uniref:hypothetical protein n=1 Tax=Lysinibacillus sp. NPDC048646 TaxID=3390574 RepID=UPI003D0401B8